jgi:hypothetical protein
MRWSEWRSLWRIDRDVDIPHLSVVVMCPYGFVRVLWYHCPKEFKAWPNQYETGVVLGWRWPWQKTFREKKWIAYRDNIPLAIYGAMDQIYVVRAAKELGWNPEEMRGLPSPQYIAPAVRGIILSQPPCPHKYWIADCPNCARKALTAVIRLQEKHLPRSVPDPYENPIDAFRRREAEAQARLLAADQPTALPEPAE